MAAGEWIGAIAMTEPSAGSDLAGMKTMATQNPDGTFTLNGSKVFITNGQMADTVIVCAKTAPEKGPHGISLFLVCLTHNAVPFFIRTGSQHPLRLFRKFARILENYAWRLPNALSHCTTG